jgi:Spy/CpxP family protein refolding chaperone
MLGTGAQQDQSIELRQTQEPALRARMQERRSVHAQLQTLALADGDDEARTRDARARAAQASGELAPMPPMHARVQHAAFSLLSPEQRKRLDQCGPGNDGAPAPECFTPPR